MTYRNRFQSGLTMLAGLFLLAVVFAILLGSLLCILLVLRWLLRPYQQLVGEAQRASTTAQHKSKDEAE
ncbi:MAG TPA: hypothetical protein VFS90_20395, partial [Pyrinomonadaceae bacterium]|nr:hypothetical protein [Pyrinomonadaceae bacterium]